MFSVDGKALGSGAAALEIVRRDVSVPSTATCVFDARTWQAWRDGDGSAWFTIGAGRNRSRTARMSPPDEAAKVSIFWRDNGSLMDDAPVGIPHPLTYPVDQILVMHLLPRFGGILIHAAGIVSPSGDGIMCAGRSGAGKTTISLAADLAGRRVLSDDRVIVRDCGGEFRVFGTPWPGDGGFARNESAPLTALRFIAKSDRNATVPLTAAAAAARLFPVCSIPWYDRECADRCVELLDRLVSTVPCAVLECTPDARAVQALESGVPVVPFVRTPS